LPQNHVEEVVAGVKEDLEGAVGGHLGDVQVIRKPPNFFIGFLLFSVIFFKAQHRK
jgi:hypothetical protein